MNLGNVVKEFHILGLGVDETDVQFLKKFEQYGALRQEKKRENAASNQRKRLQY